MRATRILLAFSGLALFVLVTAGGPVALERRSAPVAERPAPAERPTRPRAQRSEPLERPERPRAQPPAPVPPPADRLPGPLSREEQRHFDRLRIEGIQYYEEGRYPEAAQRFREALRLKPGDPVAQGWLRATEQKMR